jgi:hypothetical protein
MRGRFPAGPSYVDKLEGSQAAKERLKVVLETLAGQCRVQEACVRLGICEQLRQEALEAALAGLEPGVPGRPPQTRSPADERVHALEDQLAALQRQMLASRAREEIALTLPRVLQPQNEPEKKTRGRPRKNPLCPPGMRKNT